MTDFTIISSVNDRWSRITGEMKLSDPFYSAEYAASQDGPVNYARAAIMTVGRDHMIKPFWLRGIAGETVCDIASLPGYGGATGTVEMAAEFDLRFRMWCIRKNIVSEVCVVHPWLSADAIAGTTTAKPIVVLSTNLDDESMLGFMRTDKRQNIARAKRLGYRVECSSSRWNWEHFAEIYRQTMDRVDAPSRWRLSNEALANLAMLPQSIFFTCVGSDDRPETMSVVLAGKMDAYYHLTGNRLSKPRTGANDLLIFEVMRYCRSAGIRRLHLGGGVTADPDNSLFEYKRGFGGGVLQAKTVFRVFDRAKYERLCAKAMEKNPAIAAGTFMPVYRRAEAA